MANLVFDSVHITQGLPDTMLQVYTCPAYFVLNLIAHSA